MYTNDKNYHKVRDHCHYTGITISLSLKKLAKEFKVEFSCLGENVKKCKAFSVLITKVKMIGKNGKVITKPRFYAL